MHLAGHKIRLWREAHDPPLSAEEFGARYGDTQPWPSRTVYGWEAKGKNGCRSLAYASPPTGSNPLPTTTKTLSNRRPAR